MNTNIKDYIISIGTVEWKPLIEEGVDTAGIFIKTLRLDAAQNRPPSFILKFDKASSGRKGQRRSRVYGNPQ